jgi:hypothetical protein
MLVAANAFLASLPVSRTISLRDTVLQLLDGLIRVFPAHF